MVWLVLVVGLFGLRGCFPVFVGSRLDLFHGWLFRVGGRLVGLFD